MNRVKLAGFLMVGAVLGWFSARISMRGHDAAWVRENLLRPVLQHVPGDVVVDSSGLPSDQQKVFDNLTLRAAFVRGSDLEAIGKFLDSRTLKENRLHKQIYLVACLETRENTGQRVLSVTMEIVEPARLAGRKFRIQSGLLYEDCVYHVEQVVDTDVCLPGDDEGPSLRDEIVRSRPTFRIVSMFDY